MATHRNNTPLGVPATGLPSCRPSARLADLITCQRLRSRIEAAVARLIDALDAIDGDPDQEPNLGAAERHPSRYGRDIDHAQDGWAAGADAESDVLDELQDPDSHRSRTLPWPRDMEDLTDAEAAYLVARAVSGMVA